MKLFYKSGACSLSPHIVLREAGLDFTIESVDLASKRTEHGSDYLRINPKGQVPALLLDDGSLLTEGVAIVQYLADRVPDRALIPPQETLARYHAIEWLNYIATEIHKGFSPLFNPRQPQESKAIARAALEKQFHYLNGVLSERPYLLGPSFSVADAYLFTTLCWAKAMHFDLAVWPALADYMARIAARPAVDATLSAEGLK
ncbi:MULTISPECIES: glutathione transferase GstA [Edwardsiella]|uniref:Glutathione S-transferase n=2 Tax=Edwardsiella anguillarum TaxID=1821960 RepID=A0A076LXI8_9GAMM|nr:MULTISPECIES: glutathione transferase GstA [Edwardsiella]AKM47907.1 glutathione S-transferase [Edwardsiella sp. EA181011]GAJ68836.1 glutathione S-transferase [Edwardsiella piscicida]AIJ10149.1 Glutathione S-transferase [Edwardsiella anguillarum ET080813]AKR77727.1 glutathione transferase GstA [Edwardsiella sp. LADL05-105]KAB0592166.1 glutathione transferase GstA [Edwardsiella anguillarum]